jgi:cytochrome c2
MFMDRMRAVTFGTVSLLIAFIFALTGAPDSKSSSWDNGSPEKGKAIFQEECSICHTIGKGRKAGPDLKGVTEKRSQEWLHSFISDPEKMFKKGDAIATKLLNEYAGVRMPNLGLSEQDISDVLAYIKEKSQP